MSAIAMFRQPSSWIFVLLPNAISDFLVHCLGHEHAYRIRSFCSHSNGCLLCIGTPSPFLHPRIRILLCSWLCLRLPARCVAVRIGRTSMVGYCGGKVVVRSDPALRVGEFFANYLRRGPAVFAGRAIPQLIRSHEISNEASFQGGRRVRSYQDEVASSRQSFQTV